MLGPVFAHNFGRPSGPVDRGIRIALGAERETTLSRISSMIGELDEIVEARAYLEDLDRALARLEDGDYGTCARCGEPITSERLAARPAPLACINCAGP